MGSGCPGEAGSEHDFEPSAAGAAVAAGAGAVLVAVAVAELEDPTPVESSHLAPQSQAIWSSTEMTSEKGASAAAGATEPV